MTTRSHSILDSAIARTDPKKIRIYHSTVPQIGKHLKIVAVVIATTLFGTVISASAAHAQTTLPVVDAPVVLVQQTPPDGPADRRGPPPREAIAACSEKQEKSACGFQTPDGHQMNGTCRAPASDAPAACVPSGPPPKG